MSSRSAARLFIAVLASLSGCKALLNSLAENGPWGAMMRGAPHITHPLRGVSSSLEVPDQSGRSRYRLTSLERDRLCFAFNAPFPPEVIKAREYTVEGYVNMMDDRPGYGGDPSLSMTNSTVTIDRSTSRPEVVEVWDDKLRTFRKELTTIYQTDGTICFSSPRVPNATTRYLLLFPSEAAGGFAEYAAWQLD